MEGERPLDFFKVMNFGSKKDRFLEAPCKAGGVALRLCFYCASHPAGGIIRGMKGWKNMECFNRVRVKLKDVEKDRPGLWHWEGEDLHVDFYDKESEQSCMNTRAKRAEAGSKGGKVRAERAAAATGAADTAGGAGVQGGYDLSTEEGRLRQADEEWKKRAEASAQEGSMDLTSLAENVHYTSNVRTPNLGEVQEHMKKNQAILLAQRQRSSAAEECAQAFFDCNTRKGWKIGGNPIRDWQAAANHFVRKWLEDNGFM